MRTNRHEIAYLLGICMLALVGLTCGDTAEPVCPTGSSLRTSGCDEFTALHAEVLNNGLPHEAEGWHPLAQRDTLTTDAEGEAELNLSDCYPGHIYLFQDSGFAFQVTNCTAAEYASTGYCDTVGTWYVGDCADEFGFILTGSGMIEKTGSAFSVTYLPGQSETTLVVVFEGSVVVTPVLSLDPLVLGQGADVPQEGFYFTAPEDRLAVVGGLDPRQVYHVSQLGPVAEELDALEWMKDVTIQAEEDGVLPYTWPELLGPPMRPEGSFVVTLDGRPLLDDTRIQDAMLLSVDWQKALATAGAGTDGVVLARLPDDRSLTVEDWPYDPDRALDLFDEAGYGREQAVTILFPATDDLLAETADLVASYLYDVGIEAATDYAKEGEVEGMIQERIKAGDVVLSLTR